VRWIGEGAGGFPNVDEGPGSYCASGLVGQNIIVMPSRNLVAVHRVDTDAGRSVDDAQFECVQKWELPLWPAEAGFWLAWHLTHLRKRYTAASRNH